MLAADTQFHTFLPRTFPPFPGAQASFEGEEKKTERESSARFNATLAAGYVIMAIRSVGLAAGPMLGWNKAGVDGEFFADGRWQSILVINVGKPGPDAWKGRLERLSFDEAVKIV